MTGRAITTVLFDFGGVVIRTPFELDTEGARGPFDPSTDPEWRRFQSGEMTERDYWHRRAARHFPGAADPTFHYMRRLYDTDEDRVVRPEMRRLVADLREDGRRTAVLTNDLAAFHDQDWIDRMTIIGEFEPLVDLSHVGFLKPAPEAYAHALDVLGSEPDEVIFLDDQPANVEGASAAGIRSVRFDPTDVPGSIAALRSDLG